MGMTAEQAYVLAKNSNAGGGGTGITVDSELSLSSANPVQNKAVTKKLNDDYNSLNGAITDLNADVSSNTTAITEQTNRISNVSNTVDAITFGDGLKSINLLNPTLETSTLGNLTLAFNKENKTYTLNGSVAATKWFEVGKIELKANTTYYLSGTPKNANGCCMALKNYYGGGRDEGDGIVLTSSKNTIKEVYIYYPANTQVDNLVFKPMISLVESNYETFEPYYDTDNIIKIDEKVEQLLVNETVTDAKINELGKYSNTVNMINTYSANNMEANGISLVNNGDGTFTLNGTSTAQVNIFFPFNKTVQGDVKVLGCPSGGNKNTFTISTRKDASAWSGLYDEGEGFITRGVIHSLAIVVRNGVTLENVVFKPMITDNLNATFDSFVAYCGEGASVGENIASLYREVANLKTALSMLTGEATGDISAISGITYSNEVIDEPTIG